MQIWHPSQLHDRGGRNYFLLQNHVSNPSRLCDEGTSLVPNWRALLNCFDCRLFWTLDRHRPQI